MATTQTKTKQSEKSDEQGQENDSKQLLALSTLAPERPYCTIDEHRHEFRLLQEFGSREHREFNRYSDEYDALWGKPANLNGAQNKRMDWLLDWLFDHVLLDAGGLRKQLGVKLTGAIKREIVLAFSNAPLLMAAMAQIQEQDNEARDSSTSES